MRSINKNKYQSGGGKIYDEETQQLLYYDTNQKLVFDIKGNQLNWDDFKDRSWAINPPTKESRRENIKKTIGVDLDKQQVPYDENLEMALDLVSTYSRNYLDSVPILPKKAKEVKNGFYNSYMALNLMRSEKYYEALASNLGLKKPDKYKTYINWITDGGSELSQKELEDIEQMDILAFNTDPVTEKQKHAYDVARKTFEELARKDMKESLAAPATFTNVDSTFNIPGASGYYNPTSGLLYMDPNKFFNSLVGTGTHELLGHKSGLHKFAAQPSTTSSDLTDLLDQEEKDYLNSREEQKARQVQRQVMHKIFKESYQSDYSTLDSLMQNPYYFLPQLQGINDTLLKEYNKGGKINKYIGDDNVKKYQPGGKKDYTRDILPNGIPFSIATEEVQKKYILEKLQENNLQNNKDNTKVEIPIKNASNVIQKKIEKESDKKKLTPSEYAVKYYNVPEEKVYSYKPSSKVNKVWNIVNSPITAFSESVNPTLTARNNNLLYLAESIIPTPRNIYNAIKYPVESALSPTTYTDLAKVGESLYQGNFLRTDESKNAVLNTLINASNIIPFLAFNGIKLNSKYKIKKHIGNTNNPNMISSTSIPMQNDRNTIITTPLIENLSYNRDNNFLLNEGSTPINLGITPNSVIYTQFNINRNIPIRERNRLIPNVNIDNINRSIINRNFLDVNNNNYNALIDPSFVLKDFAIYKPKKPGFFEIQNKSGSSKIDILKSKKIKALEKAKVLFMPSFKFEDSFTTPLDKVLVSNTKIVPDIVPMSKHEYISLLQKNIPRLNEIIKENSFHDYMVKSIDENSITFDSPEFGGNKFDIKIIPGKLIGDVKSVGSPLYYKNLPGINMTSSGYSVFGDSIPRRGTRTYLSINQWLKELGLGRVKPGFNGQSEYSKGLWESYIRKGLAQGFYRDKYRNSIYGSMKKVIPPVLLGYLLNNNQYKNDTKDK